MSIDPNEITRIARLAHLELPDNDEGESLLSDDVRARLAEEIDRILEHVRDLQSVDVSDVTATAHGVSIPTRYRLDEVGDILTSEAALDQAPAALDGGFRVPKVIE